MKQIAVLPRGENKTTSRGTDVRILSQIQQAFISTSMLHKHWDPRPRGTSGDKQWPQSRGVIAARPPSHLRTPMLNCNGINRPQEQPEATHKADNRIYRTSSFEEATQRVREQHPLARYPITTGEFRPRSMY